ncbi:hypothetical protein TTHERM_00185290 (macronuclear) [Tetrahymena thermophila SB210]|uniref:C2CD3 N-terminal C2 domain-containing protein n=1 Tax=Tetrahymena thermophila (strain SB210) TaxID=312017 RepID=Q22T83_TETTS|nr:hypothetical protein TTHERM_00185290 [Tetrahymena thermophila SB210]EAR88555.2 hypothetical protein TTHERM_00185290 [Tetrahymena thermophila SB210]|eukprot:XP_001008800.2 hypothetical protein TTHERM_00185290 [Tetrahymena thermophila SB210]
MSQSKIENFVILPPGFEHISQIIYGELEVRIKKLNFLNVLHHEGDVRIRMNFFAEKGASHLLVPQNAKKELLRYFKTSYKYLIGCSIWNFSHYLFDMNILKLSVVDHNDLILGFVDIPFENFLEQNITEHTESLFKNLKGNFAIVSPKNPNQKIGSIELEISNIFDTDISKFVKKAEAKYNQAEFKVIEDCVIQQILQKQSPNNGGAINPQYNPSFEQTQTLSVKPQFQDMFGQRIPASLVQNNENYDPARYSGSSFYQQEAQNQQVQIQNINDQQLSVQNNLKQTQNQQQKQSFQNSQQQYGNHSNQKQQAGNQSNQKQQAQTQHSQQVKNNQTNKIGEKINVNQNNQSNGNINNQTLNKDSTNPNDNAFVLSSQNSLFIQKQNEMQQEQVIKMGEIEKTNKQLANKLDKLVNLGEQIYDQYQEQIQQQRALEQQRIKEEQERNLIENKRLQLQTQKLQLKEKELQEQKLERERQAQKENQQQTFKSQQNVNMQTFQKPKDFKQPFPVNQQIFSKNRLKVQMFEFNCTDSNFLAKISQKNIYVECILPNYFNCKQANSDIMKTVCKNIQETLFKFNSEINQNISILPDQINDLLNQQIEFQIKAFSIPKNTTDIRRDNNDLVTLLATSVLSVKEFLAKSRDFIGLFHLDMKTKFQSAATHDKQQESKQMVIKKQDLKPIEKNNDQIVGSFKVGISMIQDNIQQGTIYSQHHKSVAMKSINPYQTSNQYSNQPFQQPIQIIKQPTVSFQIYLKFSNLLILNNYINELNGKKIYLQFKVYGTLENILTKQIEYKNTYINSFESEFIMPCNKDTIIKMRKVPLVVEVWAKSYEKQQDDLLGLINLNLSKISNSVLNKNNNFNDNWCSSDNNSMMVIVSNENQEFAQIPSKRIIGQVFTQLVFGSVGQITKFKETQAQNVNHQSIPVKDVASFEQKQSINMNSQNAHFNQQLQNTNLNQQIQNMHLSDIPEIQIVDQYLQENIPNQFQDADKQEQANSNKIQQAQAQKTNKQSTNNKNKLSLNQYLPENNMTPSEIIYLETFECLRVNDLKIKNRIREFVNSLRPPQYFIKQFDLFNFLSNLPIKWPSLQNLVYFCKFFDFQNVSYYESELFTKSYSAYLLVEEQIRSSLTSTIQAFVEVLRINRITIIEFEKILNSNSKFGYTTKEELQNTFAQLALAGLDQQLVENILKYLTKEKDQEGGNLINVGQIVDYLKQLETYSKIRNLYQYDEQLFRDQIIQNLKQEIAVNKIQIGIISEEKTQNCLEIDIKLCKDLFQQVGIEMSFWECFTVLKEIQELNGQNTNMNYALKVPVLQFNSYLLSLENAILEQQKLPNNSIKSNDSELRDLNMLLNKSLMKNKQQDNQQKDGLNNQQEEVKKEPEKSEEHLLNYQFKFSVASMTELKIREDQDGKIVYIRYLLPLEDENWIDSGIFELKYKKENYYRLALFGTHKIFIKNTENILNVFKSNDIQIEIRELTNINEIENKSALDDNLIAKTQLTIDSMLDLFEDGSNNYVTRTTILALENSENIPIGNINFKIEFKKEIVQQGTQKYQEIVFAKEQQVQKLLPKQGFLTVNVRVSNIEEQCVVQFKLFKDDTYLNHLFKPIQQNNAIENQQYFISISKEVIKYLEEGSALVRILDENAQILIAEYEFNLINILVNQQIQISESVLNLISQQPIGLDIHLTYEKQQNQKIH